MSGERRERLVRIAHARELMILEDNPYGQIRFDGDPLPSLYELDEGRGWVIYVSTFSKILAPGMRVGWVAAPPPVLRKMNHGKQSEDLCSGTLSQRFVLEYLRRYDWRDHVARVNQIYRERRDAMLTALEEEFPSSATWTRPRGGLFVWATLPSFIDTQDLLAKSLDGQKVAFVPGAAAFLNGEGGNSMRLNYSAVPPAVISEGIARIGSVVRDLTDLFDGSGWCPMKVAVLKGGRSFEREVSLRSGANVEAALRRLGHEVLSLDVDRDLVRMLRTDRPDAAFIAMHGQGGEDGTVQELLEILGIPYTGSGVSACERSWDKVVAKAVFTEEGIPTPASYAFSQAAFRELGAADALGEIESRLGLPLVVKPARGGSALGIRLGARAGRGARGADGRARLRRSSADGALRRGPGARGLRRGRRRPARAAGRRSDPAGP